MRVKRLIAALLAVAMLATVAGCSQDKSWAASVGDKKISAGVYSMNIMMALSEASYQSGVAIEPDVSDIFAADIDGKTGSQFIIDYAQDETRRQLASDAKFTAMGLSLSEQEIAAYTESSKQMYASDGEMFKAMGVSEESVLEYNRYNYQASVLFGALYGEGGEYAPTDAEAIQNFADTYNTAYVAIYPKIDIMTGAPLAAPALIQMRADADKALADINGGKNIVDVLYEQSVATVPEGGEPVERGEDISYLMVFDKANTLQAPAVLSDFLNTAAVGDVKMVEDEQWLMIAQSEDETKVDLVTAKGMYNKMLTELKGEEYLKLATTWAQELEITFNDAAVKHYTGEQIKKDTDVYIKKVMAAQSSSQAAANTPQLSAPEISSSSDSAAPESSSDAGSSSSAG